MKTRFQSFRRSVSQKELFDRFKETKEERCERILAGKLGHKLKRASAVRFDERAYREATAIVRDYETREKSLAP